MLEILKKYGIPTATASVIVLAITFVPLYYQYKFTKQQNAKIAELEQKILALQTKN